MDIVGTLTVPDTLVTDTSPLVTTVLLSTVPYPKRNTSSLSTSPPPLSDPQDARQEAGQEHGHGDGDGDDPQRGAATT